MEPRGTGLEAEGNCRERAAGQAARRWADPALEAREVPLVRTLSQDLKDERELIKWKGRAQQREQSVQRPVGSGDGARAGEAARLAGRPGPWGCGG